ncbi:MAG: valine--tRNA ligase [Methylobacterium sp.]|nr:valine--tRNA ligase [Methylobacterium sp.]MCA4923645.1 valine--tRNA ligase [Methylobacterium sp.]
MMDKTFDPARIEARWSAAWEKAGAFKAGRVQAEPYTIVIPPPNVTGSLHMGHALNNTLQDILCRYWRMKGRDVLWQPGTDHAGIATQMVVERQMAERGEPSRREIGRAAFLDKVWAWKEESGGTIINQLKRLGASCDWSRERFTMGNREDGEKGQMQRAVLQFFVTLHEKGYLYKDKRLVNWDPKLLTAISDLEVEQREVKGNMWYFRYPLAGVEFNPEDERTYITIATTRPETMLGDGAVAVHPGNERLNWMIGRQVMLPLVNRLIPVIADEYADPEKGTGAVKITAAHDFNDYQVAKRHDVPLINLMTPTAQMVNEPHMPAQYRGLDRYECRKRVVADLDALQLLAKIEPHTHMVPHGDRSGVVIEPLLTDQWYVDVKPLAEQAMQWVREGKTRIFPANREADFFRWMENIEPWCISRQLWWGHQIPAWYGVQLSVAGPKLGGGEVLQHAILNESKIFYATSEAEAIRQAEEFYHRPVELFDDETKYNSARERFVQNYKGDPGKAPLYRDPDVLDTWFSSALWPFSTMGWPDSTPELACYYPTSALVTGFDILFFWVARMMMASAATDQAPPFRDVYLHGLVRDEKGRKMSKSVGNVIDPLVVIEALGADALRFTLASLAAQGRDPKLGVKTAEGYRNFCTKLWNASRFAEMNECRAVAGFDPSAVKLPLNRWIMAEADKALAEIEAGIEAYKFNEAALGAYRFTWNIVCDWYLELAKPVLQGEDDTAFSSEAGTGPREENASKHWNAKEETRAAVAFVLDRTVAMLHPFMPFITEELNAVYGELAGQTAAFSSEVGTGSREENASGNKRGQLCTGIWPAPIGVADAAAEAEIGFTVDLISEIRSARAEMNVPVATLAPLVFVQADAAGVTRAKAAEDALRRMARVSEIQFMHEAPAQSVQIVVRGQVACIPLAGIIDIAAEQKRLTGEREKLVKDMDGTKRKLDNRDFVARAPEEVIEENRERLAEAENRIARIDEALKRLG